MLAQAFMTSAPSKSELAKTRLLEAAVNIFGEKGPEGATVREIAQAAGQNVAAIAYYFGNKENLYRAVMEGIIREIRYHLAGVFEAITKLRQESKPNPAEALRLLKEFLRTVYLRLLSRNEAIPIAQLIVREQLRPTAGFEVLYEQGFQPLHEALCFLVGTLLGRNPREEQVILRTHMIMGQVYFFAMTRQGILRRLGWSDWEGEKAKMVADILDENIEALMAGLGTKNVERGSVKREA